MLCGADRLAGAERCAAVAGNDLPGRRDDPQQRVADRGEHGHGAARAGGRDAVVVALEGDQRRPGCLALDGDLRRVGERRQRAQRLRGAELADGAARALALVGDPDAPAVKVALRLGDRRGACGAPPGARQVLDRGLDDALALRAPRRADSDLDAVVLGQLRRLDGQAVRPGDHNRGHPVGAPHPGRAAQRDQHVVRGAGEMPEGHLLAQRAAEASRVRQRPDQREARLAPGHVLGRELQPVPLDLLARRVLDLDRHPIAAALPADLTWRPQLKPPQLAHQRRIGAIETGVDELTKQHRRLQVLVVREARLDVGAERLQAARRRRPADQRTARRGKVLAHRLAVTAGMAADRRHRPATRSKRVNLHVILLCEHPPGALQTRVAGIKHP